MKRSIRVGVFETNSSSTHSLCIVSQEEYNKWERGELVFDRDRYELVTLDEMKSHQNDEYFDEDNYQTESAYFDDCDLEGFTERYTTKSGDDIVVFGKYGYSG
jgi:hypothetical protein